MKLRREINTGAEICGNVQLHLSLAVGNHMVDRAAAVDTEHGAEYGTVGIGLFLAENKFMRFSMGGLRMGTVLVKIAAEFRQLDPDAFIASRGVSQINGGGASVAAAALHLNTDLRGKGARTELIGLRMVIEAAEPVGR